MLRNKTLSITGPLLAAALLAAACTGGGASPSPAAPTTAPATAAPATPAPSAAAATVSLSSDGYYVGPNGLTLYTFDMDSADTTNCYDQCESKWPVLSVTASDRISVGDGLDASAFSTIERRDGSLQVTFNRAPLYFFVGDTQPGDTNGVYTNWRLATTDTAPPAAVTPEASATSLPTSVAYDYGNEDKYTPAPSVAAAVAVELAGDHLVGATGFALYTFDNDTPGVSNCSGGCLDNWPALLVAGEDDVQVGNGLDDEDFATTTRGDGTFQVTYYDAPLYYFVGDSAPSDTTGDGVGGVWHLAVAQ